MKLSINYFYILAIVLLITSCTNKEEEANEIFHKGVRALAQKYKAEMDWDTSHFYTYHFQEKYLELKKPLFFLGTIYDICKTDTNYILKVLDDSEEASQYFLAVVTLTSGQFNSISPFRSDRKISLIVFVESITSSNPLIMKDENNNSNGSFSYYSLSDDNYQKLTIMTGKLIDSYPYKN